MNFDITCPEDSANLDLGIEKVGACSGQIVQSRVNDFDRFALRGLQRRGAENAMLPDVMEKEFHSFFEFG